MSCWPAWTPPASCPDLGVSVNGDPLDPYWLCVAQEKIAILGGVDPCPYRVTLCRDLCRCDISCCSGCGTESPYVLPVFDVTAVITPPLTPADWVQTDYGVELTGGGIWPPTVVVEIQSPAPSYEWQMAAAAYAEQLFLQACGSDECRIPANTLSLTRQGLSLDLDASQLSTGVLSLDQLLGDYKRHEVGPAVYLPSEVIWQITARKRLADSCPPPAPSPAPGAVVGTAVVGTAVVG